MQETSSKILKYFHATPREHGATPSNRKGSARRKIFNDPRSATVHTLFRASFGPVHAQVRHTLRRTARRDSGALATRSRSPASSATVPRAHAPRRRPGIDREHDLRPSFTLDDSDTPNAVQPQHHHQRPGTLTAARFAGGVSAHAGNEQGKGAGTIAPKNANAHRPSHAVALALRPSFAGVSTTVSIVSASRAGVSTCHHLA